MIESLIALQTELYGSKPNYGATFKQVNVLTDTWEGALIEMADVYSFHYWVYINAFTIKYVDSSYNFLMFSNIPVFYL